MLNWGDARIGNMLYRDFEPAAVLDWEMAAVGPREVDVAWMIFLTGSSTTSPTRFGMPALAGFMDRDRRRRDLRAADRPHGARRSSGSRCFAALRFAIVSVRTSTRGIAYGQMEKPDDPDDLIMFRGLLEQMLAGTYWD